MGWIWDIKTWKNRNVPLYIYIYIYIYPSKRLIDDWLRLPHVKRCSCNLPLIIANEFSPAPYYRQSFIFLSSSFFFFFFFFFFFLFLFFIFFYYYYYRYLPTYAYIYMPTCNRSMPYDNFNKSNYILYIHFYYINRRIVF